MSTLIARSLLLGNPDEEISLELSVVSGAETNTTVIWDNHSEYRSNSFALPIGDANQLQEKQLFISTTISKLLKIEDEIRFSIAINGCKAPFLVHFEEKISAILDELSYSTLIKFVLDVEKPLA